VTQLVTCVGCDLVSWLQSHVQGLCDRREARKYAAAMLHAGLIRHTVNKTTFSDQCYYTLGDIVTNTSSGELVYVIIINIIMLLLLQMLHCSVTCWPDTTRC